jgi:CheY-like chemotaxis protein
MPDHASPIRVVIVDDEPDLSFLVRVVLEGAGYEVIEARDGMRALERISASSPQLVVTDLMMPRMNGVLMIERLRANPVTAEIPIVMLSSSPDPGVADAFLSKPFKPEALLRLVGRLTARSRSDEGGSL